jgi:hypothetical protein
MEYCQDHHHMHPAILQIKALLETRAIPLPYVESEAEPEPVEGGGGGSNIQIRSAASAYKESQDGAEEGASGTRYKRIQDTWDLEALSCSQVISTCESNIASSTHYVH